MWGMFAFLKKSGAAICPAIADPSETGQVMIKQRKFPNLTAISLLCSGDNTPYPLGLVEESID